MKKTFLLLVLALCAYASCPSGYHNDGKYCMPNSKNSKPIHPKLGSSCPSGWHSDAKYCVSNR